MRYLFLIFFAYLAYQFLLRPMFSGYQSSGKAQARPRSAQDELLEMMRRMEELKRQQYASRQGQTQKTPKGQDGEYIDYEEVE